MRESSSKFVSTFVSVKKIEVVFVQRRQDFTSEVCAKIYAKVMRIFLWEILVRLGIICKVGFPKLVSRASSRSRSSLEGRNHRCILVALRETKTTRAKKF